MRSRRRRGLRRVGRDGQRQRGEDQDHARSSKHGQRQKVSHRRRSVECQLVHTARCCYVSRMGMQDHFDQIADAELRFLESKLGEFDPDEVEVELSQGVLTLTLARRREDRGQQPSRRGRDSGWPRSARRGTSRPRNPRAGWSGGRLLTSCVGPCPRSSRTSSTATFVSKHHRSPGPPTRPPRPIPLPIPVSDPHARGPRGRPIRHRRAWMRGRTHPSRTDANCRVHPAWGEWDREREGSGSGTRKWMKESHHQTTHCAVLTILSPALH